MGGMASIVRHESSVSKILLSSSDRTKIQRIFCKTISKILLWLCLSVKD